MAARIDPDDGYAEQLSAGGPPPERQLEGAQRDQELVADAVKGMTVGAMAEKYRLSLRQVSRILRTAAEQVRADTAGIVAEQFHLQLARLERLYAIVELEIQSYEEYMLAVRQARAAGTNITPVKFDERAFRVAVLIMDRQAKLLGMDRGGHAAADRSPTRWLDEAPIEEVVSYAKQLKMNLPTEFRV